jgi:hypothetical protein
LRSASIGGLLLLSCGGTAGPIATGTRDDAGDAGGGSDATAEAPMANACGGVDALVYQGRAAAPADPCGPCLDGVLVCATPDLLACAGSRPASTCPEASSPTIQFDANAADDSAGDSTVGDAGSDGDATSAGTGDAAADAGADPGAQADADAASVVAVDADASLGIDEAATDSGNAGDATLTDGTAPDGEATDALPTGDSSADGSADAPVEAAYDGGSGWMSVDGGPTVTAYGDGGLPSVRCLSLPTNDLVVDPTRAVLYTSVPSTSAAYGNSVVRIDPVAAAVSATVFAGSEPSALAMSDDGSSLYVGLNGSDSVMRIDPATGIHDAPVYLGASQYSGPYTAGVIAAVPGSSTQYVVSRSYSGHSIFTGLDLYDRSTLVGEWSAYPATGGSMAFVSSTVVDTYNNQDTGFDLNELTLTSTGFQLDSDTRGLISGFNTTIKGQGGWIFATNGEAVVGSTSQAAGQYATTGQVWPSPDGSNVWFLTSAATLQDFDRTTFLLSRSIPLPSSSGQGTPLSLDGLSSTSFVFRTSASVCIVGISP